MLALRSKPCNRKLFTEMRNGGFKADRSFIVAASLAGLQGLYGRCRMAASSSTGGGPVFAFALLFPRLASRLLRGLANATVSGSRATAKRGLLPATVEGSGGRNQRREGGRKRKTERRVRILLTGRREAKLCVRSFLLSNSRYLYSTAVATSAFVSTSQVKSAGQNFMDGQST